MAPVSLRHSTLPLSASRQERTPATPKVQTLPSATAGAARGPTADPPVPPAMPVTCRVAYDSFHTSLPLAASRQRITSLLPCPVKTYSLSPTRAGDARPSPTLTFHFFVSSLGHSFGSLKPVTRLSRLGPRHCGQSSAQAQAEQNSSRQPPRTRFDTVALMGFSPWWSGWHGADGL